MTELRAYLLRLVCCAFAATLAAAFVQQPRIARIVKLCGGCLIVLAALQPLVGLDLSALPELLPEPVQNAQDSAAAAKEQNDALLHDLIQQQTEDYLDTYLEKQGVFAQYTLRLRYDEGIGAPVPWSIAIQCDCDPALREQISGMLQNELGIPKERQEWNVG